MLNLKIIIDMRIVLCVGRRNHYYEKTGMSQPWINVGKSNSYEKVIM